MKIINPAFGLQPQSAEAAKAAAAPTDWLNDPIAIVSNSKANAQALLEGVRRLMGEFRPVDNIDYFYKNSAARAARPDRAGRQELQGRDPRLGRLRVVLVVEFP